MTPLHAVFDLVNYFLACLDIVSRHDVADLPLQAEIFRRFRARFGIRAFQSLDPRVLRHLSPIRTGFVCGRCEFLEAISEEARNENAKRLQLWDAPWRGEVPSRLFILFAFAGRGGSR